MKHHIETDDTPVINKQMLMILIPLAVILLLIIFAIIRIIIWNNGSDAKFDSSNVNPDDLASEAEDYYVAMDESLLEGREDDGLQVLFLGDDIFTYGDQETSISTLVAAETGATIYNCAFPQSTMACRYAAFQEDYGNDVFSFYRLASCIKANDYTLVEYYKMNADIYDSSFDEAIDRLKEIDFDEIDIILLGYGTYDYLNGYMTTDVTNDRAVNSYTGAVVAGIDAIHETYPHIRFAVMSPTFCFYDEGNGVLTGGDLRRTGDVTSETLGGYVVALKAICVQESITFLDNYFGIPLSTENSQEYLVDAIHVNAACRQLIANKLIDYLTNRLFLQ